MTTAAEVNAFWLEEVGPKRWWLPPSDALDSTVRARFMQAWIDAPRLAADWAGTAEGALAAILLTDQFPRNMFRNDARAYATDPLARRLARAALEAGHDMAGAEAHRQFFYLPFEHSEDLSDQHRSVALFAERMPGENLRHAEMHRDTIARFGRFPWRNGPLDRVSSPAEQRIMDAGGYNALVAGRVALDAAAPGD